MAPDDYSTSSEEHQETRAPEAHPDKNGVRQSASGTLDHFIRSWAPYDM
jgi:hypothetical protein